jgi:hypothetical protein
MRPIDKQTQYMICMPLNRFSITGQDTVDNPTPPDWKLTTCPSCGNECWESDLCRHFKEDCHYKAFCTECVLMKTLDRGGNSYEAD